MALAEQTLFPDVDQCAAEAWKQSWAVDVIRVIGALQRRTPATRRGFQASLMRRGLLLKPLDARRQGLQRQEDRTEASLEDAAGVVAFAFDVCKALK